MAHQGLPNVIKPLAAKCFLPPDLVLLMLAAIFRNVRKSRKGGTKSNKAVHHDSISRSDNQVGNEQIEYLEIRRERSWFRKGIHYYLGSLSKTRSSATTQVLVAYLVSQEKRYEVCPSNSQR